MTLTASVSDQPGWLITPLGRFAVRPGETLLATLLRTGHVVEYQCRSGYCGACRDDCKPVGLPGRRRNPRLLLSHHGLPGAGSRRQLARHQPERMPTLASE